VLVQLGERLLAADEGELSDLQTEWEEAFATLLVTTGQ